MYFEALLTLCSSVCLYHNLALGFVQGIASEYNWMSNSALGPKLCSVIEMICLLWGKALLCHQYVSSSINTLIWLASLIQKHPLDLLLYSDRISIDAACFAAKPLMNNPPQKREKKKKIVWENYTANNNNKKMLLCKTWLQSQWRHFVFQWDLFSLCKVFFNAGFLVLWVLWHNVDACRLLDLSYDSANSFPTLTCKHVSYYEVYVASQGGGEKKWKCCWMKIDISHTL